MIYTLQISRRNWSHVNGNVLKSRGFYKDFLNINVISFYFTFFKEYFLTHSVT